MVARNTQQKTSELESAEELRGKLGMQNMDDKLMRSVMEADKSAIDKGKLVEAGLDMGISAFTPELIFDQMAKDYRLAEHLYGQTIIRELFGEEPDYISKNIQIPEYRKLLKDKLKTRLKQLSDEGIIDRGFSITEKGIELASLVMYTEELDNLVPKGIAGERLHKKKSQYGGRDEIRDFTMGDRYRDIALKRSLKTSIRRGHEKLRPEDLRIFERQSKGKCFIVYALDASGSMRGEKITSCKKAGIALAYKAVSNKDRVGLIVFGEKIKARVDPTGDFSRLLKEMVRIRASKRTDIVRTIRESVEMFPSSDATKHLILLSDALPTTGSRPENETVEAAGVAANAGITISVVGINLNRKGEELARKIADVGKGKLYSVRNLESIDKIILEDYHSVA